MVLVQLVNVRAGADNVSELLNGRQGVDGRAGRERGAGLARLPLQLDELGEELRVIFVIVPRVVQLVEGLHVGALAPQNQVVLTADGGQDVVLPLRHQSGGWHDALQGVIQLPGLGGEGDRPVGGEEGDLAVNFHARAQGPSGVEAGARPRRQHAIVENCGPPLQFLLVVGAVDVR